MFFEILAKKPTIFRKPPDFLKDPKSMGRGIGKSMFCLFLQENYKFQNFVKKTQIRAKTLKYRKGPEI